ncbi:MAG: 6-phosphofructokinase [archaeon]
MELTKKNAARKKKIISTTGSRVVRNISRSRNARNIKRVACFALGGHTAAQNTEFKTLIEILDPLGYRFFGAEDGFKAFESRVTYELTLDYIPDGFAGFVAGAERNTLYNEDGSVNFDKIGQAADFFKKGKFDLVVASAGDDHGEQIHILDENIGEVDFYVENKTMDDDLGGCNPIPETDFTSGFHTAVTVGVRQIKHHFAGAWTNNLPYLICPFGRDANWIGLALSYWGNADRFVYGELPDGHKGHKIERIAEVIRESQDENFKKYGRRFAMIVIAEGTRISGIEHTDKKLTDVHGHHKLNPSHLVSILKSELEVNYGIKTQTSGITYRMRNDSPSSKERRYSKMSANVIAKAIQEGNAGMESVFLIRGDKVKASVAPIERVSEKRFASYYPRPLWNYCDFTVTDEIGKYYRTLFGPRQNLKTWLPKKPKRFIVPK